MNQIETLVSRHARDVATGARFEFGRNWARFLTALTPERVQHAEQALLGMLGLETLAGRTFLDLGSGSGLSSLAARNRGAAVVSVDCDPASVACTLELKRTFRPSDDDWTVLEGSALDPAFLARLGRFDIVYSWGVLHHTGDMWTALAHVTDLVAPHGLLFVSIYNDQGTPSRRWKAVKRSYNRAPRSLRPLFELACFVKLWWRPIVRSTLRGNPFDAWRGYEGRRGMSLWTDVVDWVGGYPFEVAKPEEIFRFFRDRGFVLRDMKTNGGSLGCNEYVFVKTTVAE
jgi:2-polyprenyl-6-hydroxyphenyl methylase/3-demethylubiquinone-9 3-methyltransferase